MSVIDLERRHDASEFIIALKEMRDEWQKASITMAGQAAMLSALTDEIKQERRDRQRELEQGRADLAAVHEKINKHALYCKYPELLSSRMDKQDKIVTDIQAKQNTHWGMIGAWGAFLGFVALAATKFASSFLGRKLAEVAQ